jgi:hypothetical protein
MELNSLTAYRIPAGRTGSELGPDEVYILVNSAGLEVELSSDMAAAS